MSPTTAAGSLAIVVLFGMLAMLEAGRLIARRRALADPESARVGTGVIEGAIFGLLGLLIAFTFSGAASRFDARRQLIVQEANAIGTAYLRLDLLPASTQPGLRDAFRRYVDSRLEIYRKIPDLDAARAAFAASTRIQHEIWSTAVSACRSDPNPPSTMLLLPALNEMIDITTTRLAAAQTHPPPIIFVMLGALALLSALLAGYAMGTGKGHNWVYILGFVAVISVTVYVILDIEFPRLGFIRLDAFDQLLVDLRNSMN